MPEFTVRFQPSADLSIRVQAEDAETAIDKAYKEKPSDLCHQCAGYRRAYSLDVEFNDIEPYEVTDTDGNTLMSEPTVHDLWQSEQSRRHAALTLLDAADPTAGDDRTRALIADLRRALTGKA